MTWYLESLDLEVWKTILFGYTFPTKDVDGGKIRKTLDEYNEEKVMISPKLKKKKSLRKQSSATWKLISPSSQRECKNS